MKIAAAVRKMKVIMQDRLAFTLLALMLAALAARADDLSDCRASDAMLAPQTAIALCSAPLADTSLATAARAEILAHAGIAHRQLDNLAQSEALLTEAATLAKDDAYILRMLGWTLREAGELHRAEQILTHSLTLEGHWQAYLSRCVARQDLHEYRLAVDDCEQALRQTWNTDTAFFTAHAHHRLLNADRALAVARVGMALPDTMARIYSEAAIAFETLGQPSQAAQVLDKALARWPEDPDLIWQRENLP